MRNFFICLILHIRVNINLSYLIEIFEISRKDQKVCSICLCAIFTIYHFKFSILLQFY